MHHSPVHGVRPHSIPSLSRTMGRCTGILPRTRTDSIPRKRNQPPNPSGTWLSSKLATRGSGGSGGCAAVLDFSGPSARSCPLCSCCLRGRRHLRGHAEETTFRPYFLAHFFFHAALCIRASSRREIYS